MDLDGGIRFDFGVVESAAPDDGFSQVSDEPDKEVLALGEVAEGWTSGSFGGGPAGLLRFREEMEGETDAGRDHLLDGQAVFFGVQAVQVWGDDLPGLVLVGDHDRPRVGWVGVDGCLA